MIDTVSQIFAETVLSVSDYTELINNVISPITVSVRGEVGDLKILSHWVFFALHDEEENMVLRCGLHTAGYRAIGVGLSEGMLIRVDGYGKVSPKTGNFGFWVSDIEPLGEGALARAYAVLVQKLSQEGLFTRKRTLPECIKHVVVLSSRDGVVLQDLRTNLRQYGIRIDFIHTGVEGAGSAQSIASAIARVSRMRERPQALVLIRGGGSLESLQGFNHEAVARALFACPIPTIVGVGHDVDVPIAALVADVGVSTPTAVAHAINETWSAVPEVVSQYMACIMRMYELRYANIASRHALALRTINSSIRSCVVRAQYAEELCTRAMRACVRGVQRVDARAREIEQSALRIWRDCFGRVVERITTLERLIALSDPKQVVARGYGIVYKDDRVLSSVEQAPMGAPLKIVLRDGTLGATITKKETHHD